MQPFCLRLLAWSIGLAFLSGPASAAPALTANFDANGLRSLSYAGEEFLQDGSFRVERVVLERWDGSRMAADLKPTEFRFDPAAKRLGIIYAWGEVRCTYTPEPNRLGLTIDVANRGESTLAELGIHVMETRFPTPPDGWKPHYPYRAFNLGSPTVIPAVCKAGVLAVCNEDPGRPLQVGWAGRESLARRPLVVATSSDWMSEMLNPMLRRPIHPGRDDRYEISLRFAPAGTPAETLGSDVVERFAQAHPYRLKWPDRRPVGALFLSTSDLKAARNPRGWFQDRQADFLSEEGRQALRERVLAHARESLKVLKSVDAQGMIVWDIEGQEYPHAISYLGDPRSLPPEMEPVADDYFRVFTDAGLRVGVCVRPQLPVRTAYGAWVNQIEAADPAAVLDAKIAYAKKRWGCTLFYVDSNGDPNVPFPAEVFARVAAKHPDVLLIPEHESTGYYAHTAPYRCFANLKQFGTPEHVRRVYPEAFSVVYVGHGDPAPVRDRLLEDVRRGDILVVHGWYANPNHAVVKEIYAQARGSK